MQPISLLQDEATFIRLAVMLYVRFPLSLRNVEGLLSEHCVAISHVTDRF